MIFGSVCSGIESASIAWEPLGFKAAWFAEIEAFPSAVLAHHWPEVPNFGDMCVLPYLVSQGLVEAPDILVGGTPCQAFSVAGLRKGLGDERGQLTMKFVELANEIDNKRPGDECVVVWENVPGVLSSKDNAFGCFLGALAGEYEPLQPAGPRWSNAGCVYGPERTIAWRVLDAQYFGVAQRHRRVFVVASARNGFDPASVLFEPEGLRRDTPPSRTEGPGSSGTSESGVDIRNGTITGEVARTLQAGDHAPDPGGTPHAVTIGGNLTHTLRGEGFDASEGGTGRGTPIAALPVCHGCYGQGGAEVSKERCPTLTCNHEAPICFDPRQDPQVYGDMAGPCSASVPPNAIASYAFQPRIARNGRGDMGDIVGALNAQSGTTGKGDAAPHVAIAGSPYGSLPVMPTMVSGGSTEGSHNSISGHFKENYLTPTTAPLVRRLTPVECERLQGFNDNHTRIPWRGKAAEDCPDGPRYKAIGNSKAVPVIRFVGTRIQQELNK